MIALPVVRLRMLALLAAILWLATGCSWILDDKGLIQDRRNEYREARTSRIPDVPADLDSSRIHDAMVVPEVPGMAKYRKQDDFELPRPATLFAREEDRGVRIQKFDGNAWIVAPDQPALVWPRVMQFLSDNGLEVASENPEAGIIETDWVQVKDTDYRDVVRSTVRKDGGAGTWQQLRLRIEQAVRRGATEVHLEQAGGQAPGGAVDWSAGSTNPAIAADLLNELAGYLAADVAAGVSFVAQDIAAESKAELIRDSEGPPALLLRLQFARAWATVNTALDNAEIPIESSDQADRSYHVRYNPAQFRGDKPGWFSHLFDFARSNPNGRTYLLRLVPVDQGFDVRVFADDGSDVDRETSEQILSVLREFAS